MVDGKGVSALVAGPLTSDYLVWVWDKEKKAWVQETHRHGISPVIPFGKRSGAESTGVDVNLSSGSGYSTTHANDGDKSRLQDNTTVYGEIYGNGSGKAVGNAEYDRQPGDAPVVFIPPNALWMGENAAGYGEDHEYRYIRPDGSVETIAKVSKNTIAERISEMVRGKNVYPSREGTPGEIGIDTPDSASSKYPLTGGISSVDGQVYYEMEAGPQSDWWKYGQINCSSEHDCFMELPASLAPKGKLYHIGPLCWRVHGFNPTEETLHVYVKDGKGKELTHYQEGKIGGIHGKQQEENLNFDWPNGIEYEGGIIIQFCIHFDFTTLKVCNAPVENIGEDTGLRCYAGSLGKPLSKYNECKRHAMTKSHGDHKTPSIKYSVYKEKCSFVRDAGSSVVLGVPTTYYMANWSDRCWFDIRRQPKYNGDENIYRYVVRFKGHGPTHFDWDGTPYHSNDGTRMFDFAGDNRGELGDFVFTNDGATDIYHVHIGDNLYRPGQSIRFHTYYNVHRYVADIYKFSDDYKVSRTTDVSEYRSDACIVLKDTDVPGQKPASTWTGWNVFAKNDAWEHAKPRGIYDTTQKVIKILGDHAKIMPRFEGTPLHIIYHSVTGINMNTGMEEYDAGKEMEKVFSEIPVKLPDINSLPQSPFFIPIGWYSDKYGKGTYITQDANGMHTFRGNMHIYAHYVFNKIEGIEWKQIDSQGKEINPVNDFTGKDNVFFVGRDNERNANSIKVCARVYPIDPTYYGQITRIVASNSMFKVEDVDNATGGQTLYRVITPSDTLVASTIDYMTLTAYTNVGMKSQAFIFYVDRVDVTLNTEIITQSGNLVLSASLGDSPTDEQLTAKFKEKYPDGPMDGDGIDEEHEPYHRMWVYHSSPITVGSKDRNWVNMGSISTRKHTDLGKLSGVPNPQKFTIINNRVVECIFMGWCDAKGTMYSGDMVFLRPTAIYASWVRPEDFAETDMMVLQKPESKGKYDRLLQLKFSVPTKMGLSYKMNAQATAVPLQKAENAFVFDSKVEQSINVSLSRVSPDPYDDKSDDTDKWSNGKWMESLIGMQNRYQAETDGEKYLYIPLDCGLRRYRMEERDAVSGSYYRYTYYGFRYPLVGKCTDAPKGQVEYFSELPEKIESEDIRDRIYYVTSIDKMAVYDERDDDPIHWHLLMGHDTDSSHWDKGFLYTNAYGEKHYYLGRNVYIKKIDPTYKEGEPTIITFDVNMEVGGIKENEKDVIEW